MECLCLRSGPRSVRQETCDSWATPPSTAEPWGGPRGTGAVEWTPGPPLQPGNERNASAERGTRGVERSEAGREAKTANGMERKIGMLGETDPGIRDGCAKGKPGMGNRRLNAMYLQNRNSEGVSQRRKDRKRRAPSIPK